MGGLSPLRTRRLYYWPIVIIVFNYPLSSESAPSFCFSFPASQLLLLPSHHHHPSVVCLILPPTALSPTMHPSLLLLYPAATTAAAAAPPPCSPAISDPFSGISILRQTEGFFALFQREAKRGYGDWHPDARLRIPNRGPGILICSVGQRLRSKTGTDRQTESERDGLWEGALRQGVTETERRGRREGQG